MSIHDNLLDTLRRRLSNLGYEFRQFSIDHFAQWVGDRIGREILRVPWEMPPGLFGAWISDADDAFEYIFYDRSAPPLLQVHIQLHELAHILLGHTTLFLTKDEMEAKIRQWAWMLFPEQDCVLLRSIHSIEQDVEAETFAALIQEEVIRSVSLRQLTTTVSSHESLAAYIRAMGIT
jgi:hypothetical protein